MLRKHSKKREEILNLLRSTNTHPGAEWIYSQLKPTMSDLSLATVYRNLTLFRQNNEVVSVGVVNGQERFDANISPHAHFICQTCGRVIDVGSDYLANVAKEEVEKSLGASISGIELVFHGSCKNCIGN